MFKSQTKIEESFMRFKRVSGKCMAAMPVAAGLIMASVGWAGVSSTAYVRGKVVLVRGTEVTLNVDGRKMVVARSTIPSHFKVWPGSDVTAVLPFRPIGASARGPASQDGTWDGVEAPQDLLEMPDPQPESGDVAMDGTTS